MDLGSATPASLEQQKTRGHLGREKKKTHTDSNQADVMSKASVRRMQTERERNDALRQGLGGTVEWFMQWSFLMKAIQLKQGNTNAYIKFL